MGDSETGQERVAEEDLRHEVFLTVFPENNRIKAA
jgi:hypothetical protein